MAEWIRTMRGALTFDTAVFTRFHDRRDVFFRGFILIVLVAPITGLPGLVIDAVKGLRPTSVQAEMDEARTGFDRFVQQFEPGLAQRDPGRRRVRHCHGADARGHGYGTADR